MNQYKKQIIFCWWVALVATTVGSLLPNMGPPTTPIVGIGMDKYIHLGTYLVLAAVPTLYFRLVATLVWSVILVALMSIGIEIAQNLVPGRLFSAGDVAANMLGVFLGVVIGLYFRRQESEYSR